MKNRSASQQTSTLLIPVTRLSSWCTCTPTKAYVLADIAAIFTQLIGTVLPASGTAEGQRLSIIVVLVGLLVQLLALGAFIVVCGRLHSRLRRDPSASRAMLMDRGVNWLGYFIVLEVAAVMLVVRSIMRGAEYLGGVDGAVASHEVFIYVFDSVPMLVVMVGFLVLHPSRLESEVSRLDSNLKLAGVGEMTELRGSRGPHDMPDVERHRWQEVPMVFQASRSGLDG